jgi:uncharacterized protein (TIGR02246 family)
LAAKTRRHKGGIVQHAIVLVVLWNLLACGGGPPAATEQPTEVAAEPSPADLEQRLMELSGRYIDAYNSANVDGLVALYTADALRLPPQQPIQSGRAEIRRAFQELFEQSEAHITIQVVETRSAGKDLAFARGVYATVIQSRSGGPAVETVGKWMDVLERGEDGIWRIAREVSNTDHPPETT